MSEEVAALVIGAGPAGLAAAEMLGARGHAVVLAEALPSPARKFLMAGRSGLNITNSAPQAAFAQAYGSAAPHLAPMLGAFGAAELAAWAEGLGQQLFEGSGGKIFPRAMKGSPLLRAWLARLRAGGAALRTGWRWQGWAASGAALFETPQGPRTISARTTVLALGGASWARLGSNGAWAPWLAEAGVPVEPFQPANAGLCVAWSAPMARWFGAPLKGCALRAGQGGWQQGEVVISARGLEGGGLYPLTPALREGAPLAFDLFPGRSAGALATRLASHPRGRASHTTHWRKALKLEGARAALALELLGRPLPEGHELATALKRLVLHHKGPRPLDEAISTAGGVGWAGLDEGLMLRARPGTFCAGEMLDWEAPTGGYLLTGCLATGRWAGLAAARRLEGPA